MDRSHGPRETNIRVSSASIIRTPPKRPLDRHLALALLSVLKMFYFMFSFLLSADREILDDKMPP